MKNPKGMFKTTLFACMAFMLCLASTNFTMVYANSQEMNDYGMTLTKTEEGNITNIHYESVDNALYRSYLNLSTNQHASIRYTGNTRLFPCGTGELTFQLQIDKGYQLDKVESKVSNLTKHGNTNDFIEVTKLDASNYAIKVKHPSAHVGAGLIIYNHEKHFHGNLDHSQLQISSTFQVSKDASSNEWKNIQYYENDKDIFFTDTAGYKTGDTVDMSKVKPSDHDQTHKFIGYTTDPNLVKNTQNLINKYADYLEIKDQLYTNTYTIPEDYTGKAVNMYAVYLKNGVIENKLALNIEYKLAPNEVADDSFLLPEAYTKSGFSKNQNFNVDSPIVKGYVADPKTVSVTFQNADINRTVYYYADRNGDGLPDNQQDKYSVSVSYQYALGEAGDASLLPSKFIEDGFISTDKYSVKAPAIANYVAIPTEISGIINDKNIDETILYYKDMNHNGEPDSQETKYTVDVDYKYADGEIGDEALLPASYHQGDLIQGNSYEVNAPTLKGYVAKPGKISGTINSGNIQTAIIYYEDRNENSIPDQDEAKFNVDFIDYNGILLSNVKVLPGLDADIPSNPSRSGYTFNGWSGNYKNVMKDETVIATYRSNGVIIPPTPTTPALPEAPLTPTAPIAPILPNLPVTPAPILPAAPAPVLPVAPAPNTETVTVNETPKSNGNTETVKQIETPKSKGVGTWALINLIAAALTILLAFIALFSKQKQEDKKQKKQSYTTKVLTMVIAIAITVFFLLTENVALKMVMTDEYTLWMTVITIIQLSIILVSKRSFIIKPNQASHLE